MSQRRARLPFALVLLSLISLALLPLGIMRETNARRDWVTYTIAPARQLVTQVQSAIALESAATRGYLVTGDRKWVEDYSRAMARTEQGISELAPLAHALGPGVATELAALTMHLRSAHVLIDSLYTGRMSRSAYATYLGRQQDRLEEALREAADLDRALDRAAAATSTENRSIQRLGAIVTVTLVVLALVAAALVARLGNNYRAIAIKLDESEQRFRQIADNIHDFIWLSDASFSRHLYANAAYDDIWGRSRLDLRSNPWALLEGVHPDDRQRVRDALAKLPEGEYDIEFRVVRPNGDLRWVWSRGFPVRNERGEIYRIAGITEDVTDRKQAAESRTRLIRGFTHDVKNPLGAADGFLALLQEGVQGGLAPKQLESVGRIRRSIRAALDLIAHLLDIARAEAGQLETVREPFDVGATTREVADEFRAKADAKHLDFQVTLYDPVPGKSLVIKSDRGRVRQIVANLLSNAVKYTRPEGRIEVGVECRSNGSAPAPGRWVAVSVADTGTGIPPEKQGMLFREFARFDARAAEGSGIGLAISKKVAQALDAEITVQSEVGIGSTFTLWIPADRASWAGSSMTME